MTLTASTLAILRPAQFIGTHKHPEDFIPKRAPQETREQFKARKRIERAEFEARSTRAGFSTHYQHTKQSFEMIANALGLITEDQQRAAQLHDGCTPDFSGFALGAVADLIEDKGLESALDSIEQQMPDLDREATKRVFSYLNKQNGRVKRVTYHGLNFNPTVSTKRTYYCGTNGRVAQRKSTVGEVHATVRAFSLIEATTLMQMAYRNWQINPLMVPHIGK